MGDRSQTCGHEPSPLLQPEFRRFGASPSDAPYQSHNNSSCTPARPRVSRREAVPGAVVSSVPLDLADLASVSACAQRVLDSGVQYDVWINNAGARHRELEFEQNMTHVSNASRQLARREQNMTHVSNASRRRAKVRSRAQHLV
jgi:hypothetical protein